MLSWASSLMKNLVAKRMKAMRDARALKNKEKIHSLMALAVYLFTVYRSMNSKIGPSKHFEIIRRTRNIDRSTVSRMR